METSESIVAVAIIALMEDENTGGPIVILHDPKSDKVLPIWIGEPEARAIAYALNNSTTPRPLTHQLILTTIKLLAGHMSRVVIDRLENNTYFASLYIEARSKNVKIDARPSDAIAIALHARVPIFVATKIMDTAAQKNPFPTASRQQKKREMSREDIEQFKKLFERARQREEQSSGN